MDYISENIGFRVDETKKTFCVIIRKDGRWREFGERQRHPSSLFQPPLSAADYASELALSDRSRLVPHTQPWLDYRMERLDKLINGEELDEKLPVEFCDVLIAHADAAPGTPGKPNETSAR
jgi:hypothetical protein